MKRILKRSVSLLLAGVMTTSIFAGCTNTEKSVIEAEATAVDYNAKGEYTTKLKVDKTKFTGITADDVKVVYSVLDEEGYNTALKKASNDESDVDIEPYYKDIEAKITDVTIEDDTSMTLSFSDEKAAENLTNGYSVYIENKNIGAGVEVNFTDYILTPETDYVLASDDDIRLTLTLKEGEFAKDISKDNINLSSAFEDMNIESLSSAGKNLTMQLTGKPVIHEPSGVYLDGIVEVDSDGIVNAYTSTKASVPVKTEMARFVSEEITVDGSTVKVPLVLIDVADVDSLTKNSFSFENAVKVTDCRKDSDTQVTLTMTVDGAKDKNSAAKILDGQSVKIKNDYEFTAKFVSAEFYPVFDYVEDNGDNLEITLELYSNSGTFADKLENNMFSFSNDFEKASIVSVKRTGDTTAELIISVPANGQTSETLDIDGEVILAAGSLINKWGDKTENESAYMRNYSQENMGKDLSSADIDSIKNIVGGFGNTTFGTIKDVASGASTGFTVVKTILEMTGVIQSEHAQVMAKLDKISNQVKQVQDTLDKHTKMLQDLQASVYNTNLSSFDTNVSMLNTYCEYIAGYFNDANVAKLGINQPSSKASDTEWTQYNENLITAMEAAEKNGNKNFKGFTQKYEELEKLYIKVATELSKTNNQNPLYLFDQLCTLTYNFDTSAYTARTAYRVNLQYDLERALSYILLYYNFGANPANSQCKVNNKLYTSALVQINNRTVDAKPGQRWVYCYSFSIPTQSITVNSSTSNYAFPYYKRNFTNAEKNEFVKRMNGRTLAKEIMDLAGIKVTGQGSVGLAFSCEKHNNGSWYWAKCRHYTNYYADIIGWDSSKIEKYNSYYEGNKYEYGTYKLWS